MKVEEKSKGADPSSGGSGRLKRKACAACRHQRNKCREDCQLAPHFPAECHNQFMNAHDLYGVGNMRSLLRRLDPMYHSDAMKTVKYESDARARDRSGGCFRIILQLYAQYQSLIKELDLVNQHLDFYRNQTNPYSSNHNDGNANGNNVTIYTNLDQQQLQDQDQPASTSFCSDIDASADDALNYFLNEDDANILVDDDVITADYNNGNEPALLDHDQQFPNSTDQSVYLLSGYDY